MRESQTMKKEYTRGSAKDCRLAVQKLNEKLHEIENEEENEEHNNLKRNYEDEEDLSKKFKKSDQQQIGSKWSKYLVNDND